MVKTPASTAGGKGSIPGRVIKILHATSTATTKTQQRHKTRADPCAAFIQHLLCARRCSNCVGCVFLSSVPSAVEALSPLFCVEESGMGRLWVCAGPAAQL